MLFTGPLIVSAKTGAIVSGGSIGQRVLKRYLRLAWLEEATVIEPFLRARTPEGEVQAIGRKIAISLRAMFAGGSRPGWYQVSAQLIAPSNASRKYLRSVPGRSSTASTSLTRTRSYRSRSRTKALRNLAFAVDQLARTAAMTFSSASNSCRWATQAASRRSQGSLRLSVARVMEAII